MCVSALWSLSLYVRVSVFVYTSIGNMIFFTLWTLYCVIESAPKQFAIFFCLLLILVQRDSFNDDGRFLCDMIFHIWQTCVYECVVCTSFPWKIQKMTGFCCLADCLFLRFFLSLQTAQHNHTKTYMCAQPHAHTRECVYERLWRH